MPDEKTSQLGINVGKRVKYYVIYFSVVFLFLIWGNDLINLITISLATDPEKSDWAQKIIASLITALGAGAFLIMNLGRDIDLHNFIDRVFFHVRRNTNKIIQQEMIRRAQIIDAHGWKNMEKNQQEVTRLFYHFVNDQETLRSLAFTYWEQYFVNIYIICFGTLSFIISTIWVCVRSKLDIVAFSPVLFLFVVIIIAISTRSSLVPKIYNLPIQQIGEICNSNAKEFKDQIKSRFGGIVTQ